MKAVRRGCKVIGCKVNNNDLDANNFYVYALLASLAVRTFHFLDDPKNFDVDAVDSDGAKDVLEVDVKDRDMLHNVAYTMTVMSVHYNYVSIIIMKFVEN